MHMRTVSLTCLLVALAAPAFAQPLVPQYPRTIMIAFDPILENEGNQRLHTRCNWGDPFTLSATYSSDLSESSHGLMNYRRMQSLRVDEYPRHVDGFRYNDEGYMQCYLSWSGWHTAGTDYKSQVRDYDLARKVEAGMVDEVFIEAFPFTGYWESTMCGKGGYWCNSSPQRRIASSKIFVMMGFNYERGVGEMLEDYGHRSESILWHTYGSWSAQKTHAWNRFTLYDKNYPGEAACGNVHFAPNSQSDYDWGNSTYVWSYCQDWLDNYPNLQNTKVWVNSAEWGYGDIRLHHKWWFERFPHVAGSITDYGNMVRLNNWWEYTQNFNHWAEAGGDYLSASPPAATAYAGPKRQITSNTLDDWAPKANASGRLVWAAQLGDYEIFSCNADGSGLVQITANSIDDEAPQINAAGQIVWQAFDGQDYEIYTANADGTNIVRITNNAVNDWHPTINNAGLIAWAQFDGMDYEIMSGDAAGTYQNIVTENYSAGYPADDLWPQINNQTPPRIVWMGYDGADWEIYSANFDGSNLVNVSNNTREDEYPVVNDSGRVVWHSFHNDTNAEIWSCPATGGTPVQLSSNSGEDWYPQINAGGQVVWMSRVGSDWEIVTRPADASSAAVTLTSNSTNDTHPRIDDSGRIAWQGWDGSDFEIYARIGGTIYQITNNTYHDRWVSLVNADLMVWHAESTPGAAGNTSEIWAAGTATLDTIKPVVLSAEALSATTVRVRFSEPLTASTAQNSGNYALTPARAVTNATLQSDQKTVLLTTQTLADGQTYTLAVSNVQDQAVPPNTILPNSTVQFAWIHYERVTNGLLALYTFDEGSGTIVNDSSGVAPACNLTIEYPQNTTWTAGGLKINSGPYTRMLGPSGNTKIASACIVSDAVTVEAWVTPAQAVQYGPARIFTLSSGTSARNFTLGHGDTGGTSSDKVDMRIRTSTSDTNGRPAVVSPGSVFTAEQVHLVFTRNAAGSAVLYVNGSPVATETRSGTFDNWVTSHRVALGNEVGTFATNVWLGTFHLAAVYSRALTPVEVAQNYGAGAEPAPPPTGACCFPDGYCEVLSPADCSGVYQGEGTTCDPNPCPLPSGACCLPDGSCLIKTEAECAGTYMGDETTCSPSPCPQPTGACCLPDGSCATTTAAACTGAFQGAGTSCATVICAPAACAGDANCDGVIDWRDIDYLVAAQNDNEAAWTALFGAGGPACTFANCDADEDGHVDWRDIDPFVALMNTTCP